MITESDEVASVAKACDTSACIAIVWDSVTGSVSLAQIDGTPPNHWVNWTGETTIEELERFIDGAKGGAFDHVLDCLRAERDSRGQKA